MKKNNNALVILLFTFVLLIVSCINSLCEGIEKHQTWRIVLASAGGAGSAAIAIITAYYMIRNYKNAA